MTNYEKVFLATLTLPTGIEEDILPVERFDNTDTVEGSWIADEDRTIVLVFDNTYSFLRGKTVAYLVGTTKPSAEDAAEVEANAAAMASAEEGDAPATPEAE